MLRPNYAYWIDEADEGNDKGPRQENDEVLIDI